MNSMFYYISSLQTLTFGKNFDTSSVEDMSSMFSGAIKLTKIIYGPNFIHKDGANTSSMFSFCPANKPDKNVHPSWEGVF